MQGTPRQQYMDAKALESLKGHPGLLALQGQQYDDLSHLLLSWVKGPQDNLSFHVHLQGQVRALLNEMQRMDQAARILNSIDPQDPHAFDERDRGGRTFPWLHAWIDRLKGVVSREKGWS